jgi:hypothetical protein
MAASTQAADEPMGDPSRVASEGLTHFTVGNDDRIDDWIIPSLQITSHLERFRDRLISSAA